MMTERKDPDMFSVNGNELLFEGHTIYKAPFTVHDPISLAENAVVFSYDPAGYASRKGYFDLPRSGISEVSDLELINRNVMCVSSAGEVIWRIGLCDQLTTHADPYNYIYEEKGHWIAVTDRGHECDLDIETGKVSNTRYFASR